jgi:hypothetical protein
MLLDRIAGLCASHDGYFNIGRERDDGLLIVGKRCDPELVVEP